MIKVNYKNTELKEKTEDQDTYTSVAVTTAQLHFTLPNYMAEICRMFAF